MGVLDDAIRDHLDLKRRRGADPAEVERAEREALGPVRRGPEPVLDDPPAGGSLPYDDEDIAAPAFDNGPAIVEVDDDPWAGDPEPEWDPEPEGEHSPPAIEPAPSALSDPRPVPTPAPHPAPPPEPHAAPAPEPPTAPTGDETVEYRVPDALAHEPGEAHEPAEEDVLEETPEFLQDTPDHDRLWFEQRPPRDFDFDG